MEKSDNCTAEFVKGHREKVEQSITVYFQLWQIWLEACIGFV